LKLTQIDNACCVYEHNGFRLLTDPWLTEGAFEGSWFHVRPLLTKPYDVKDVNALYISHIHPDHYDPRTLDVFPRSIPILVLDRAPNFLTKKLTEMGFNNLIKLQDGESTIIGPFTVTMYAPFVYHPYEKSDLGNFLDSSIVVECDGVTILNANDNTPTVEVAKKLRAAHGDFTIAQLKDCTAGPYPACFSNLNHIEKLEEKQRLIVRQLTAMCEVAEALGAKYFQPFAGAYTLSGRLASKNQYLAIPTPEYAANFIRAYELEPLVLSENESIEFPFEIITRSNYFTHRTYWDNYVLYPYEVGFMPEKKELDELVFKARQRLLQFQIRFNYFPQTLLKIRTDMGHEWEFFLGKPDCEIQGTTIFTMDDRALKAVLTKDAHWNNLEVGCHLEIYREPNIYDPDLVNAMCFFHT
jgi:UDP-MurNAc hydroxylase